MELTTQALQAAGYSNPQVIEHQGQRHVRAMVGETPVAVIHNNCENNVCRIISFAVFFGEQPTIDDKYMNAWNGQMRFSRLFRAPQNNQLIFTMDAVVAGVQPQYVAFQASLFANLLKQLFEFKPS